MDCDEKRDRLEGDEAYRYRLRCLKLLVDRQAKFESLFVCRKTGQFWEQSVEGRWSEKLILSKVSPEYAASKYGVPT